MSYFLCGWEDAGAHEDSEGRKGHHAIDAQITVMAIRSHTPACVLDLDADLPAAAADRCWTLCLTSVMIYIQLSTGTVGRHNIPGRIS